MFHEGLWNHCSSSINTSRGVFPLCCGRAGIWQLEFVQLELFLIISLYLLSLIQFHIAVWSKNPSNASFLILNNKTFRVQDYFWDNWNIYWPEISVPSGLRVHALGNQHSRKPRWCIMICILSVELHFPSLCRCMHSYGKRLHVSVLSDMKIMETKPQPLSEFFFKVVYKKIPFYLCG